MKVEKIVNEIKNRKDINQMKNSNHDIIGKCLYQEIASAMIKINKY